MSAVAKQFEGKSQAEIHKAVCHLSKQILKKRGAKGYGEQAELQRIRRHRSELQALLTKPTLVWSAP